MDIYITEIKSGTRVALSMLPETVKLKTSGKFQSYDVMNIGEVKIPKGEKLAAISWSGTLPGASRRSMSYIKSQHWQSPNTLIGTLEGWKKNGSKLKVMVTGTVINHDVYINDFSPQPKGGNGDYEYAISFVQAKDIAIYTTSELGMQPASPSNSNVSTNTRPAAPKKTTYTVVRGDCLWNIAKRFLGAGNRYMDIYNANKSVIGRNPNLIYAGQVYTIPQ